MIFLTQDFDLEKRNFENLCHMHKSSLLRIIQGVDGYKILDAKERSRLVESGVLIKLRQKLTVTDRAYRVISSLD